MTQEEQTTLAGWEDGWTHASYVDVYGGPEIPDPIPVPPGFRGILETYYIAGFEEGVERFRNEMYADGSPIAA